MNEQLATPEFVAYPEWTEYRKKNGLDPLGMQNSSVNLYQTLLPGISNVTLRMRYYGLYAWLAQCYAKQVGDTDPQNWKRYVRRAEALYALIASHHGGETGVTDKTHPKYNVRCDEWPVSNPKGYGIWFQSRQSEAVMTRKRALMETDRVYASVDDVPDYKVKTPLQRAIQLLKRHRDTMFNGDDDKPISIIITTLSAHAYNGEPTIGEALRSILKNMQMYIEDKGGVKWVGNPVNPMENFADKWLETPQKEENFFSWLEKARRDFGLYLTANVYSQVPAELQEALSNQTVTKVLPMIALAAPAVVSSADAGAAEAAKVIQEGGATKPWRR